MTLSTRRERYMRGWEIGKAERAAAKLREQEGPPEPPKPHDPATCNGMGCRVCEDSEIERFGR